MTDVHTKLGHLFDFKVTMPLNFVDGVLSYDPVLKSDQPDPV